MQREDIPPLHPLTFKPEFIDAYELGTKNTLLDGAMTINGDIFYYNYKGYQISQIVDRTAINRNFDATVKGAELEATWDRCPASSSTSRAVTKIRGSITDSPPSI